MHRPSAPSNMETNDNPTRSSKPADTNSKNKRSRDDDENAVSSGRSVSEEHDEDVAARSLESKRAYSTSSLREQRRYIFASCISHVAIFVAFIFQTV
jgi:hypothetical protein